MRRVIVGIVIALVVLIGGGLALAFSNVDKFRPRVQTELQNKLNRPVGLGHLGVRLFPLSIRIDDVTIGEAAEFGSNRPFATAKEVYVSAGLMSLIRGNPEVKDLTLDRPQVELIRNPAGVWNFSTIGGGKNTGGTSGGTSSGGSTEFTLDRLQITDGQVGITDQVTKAPRSVYNHIDLALSDFGPNKQFAIDLGVHFPGPGKELLAFKGNGGPLQSGNAAATPINGHFSVQEVRLSGVNSVSPATIPPNTDGVATGDGTISSSNELLSAKGTLKIDNAVITGSKMPYPIEATYDASDDRKTDKIQIRSAVVKAGPTAVTIGGTVDARTTPSNLNVRLTTNNASIPELLRLAALFGAGNASSANQVKGDLTADLTMTGPMNQMNGSGTLSSNTLQAQDLVLKNVRARCTLDKGVLQLAPVTSNVFGGTENGTVSVDTRPANPACSVKMNFSGVDTNALLSAVSSMKNKLYGSMAANTNLSFTLASSTDLARTLNGTLGINVTNGRLQGINLLNELSKIGKFTGAPAQSGSGTALKTLSGTMNIVNGVGTTNDLKAVLDAGSLAAAGTVNLVDQALNLHLTAVLNSGLSKSVGGTGVGGFMNTALANNQGELVLPVIVTGTMDQPKFSPDVEAMAKMKINKLLPTTGNPSALVGSMLGQQHGAGGIVGGLLGNAQGQTNAQGQQKNQQQQNPVDSLLKGLGKKKPKQ